MNGGKILDEITIELASRDRQHRRLLYVDIFDNSLSRKWLTALDQVLSAGLLLEKNYCFFGFVDHERDGWFLLQQVNQSIDAINRADIGYHIDDLFTMEDCITDQPEGIHVVGRNLVHARLNSLHRYFEDLQGVSGQMSPYYERADATTRWHIRQLNLLCHEFESWALSYRKQAEAPEWQRPSQLMCWLNSPRFHLEEEDYELFGIETINRDLGAVFVGVNKAVGKHHWEVFIDEGRDSRIGELISSTLRSQTEAAADFDIEWGRNPGTFEWHQQTLRDFREWLIANGFDPENKALTIGHPQVGQVDLSRSFGTKDFAEIWQSLNKHLDVIAISTGRVRAEFPYHWSDPDFQSQQIQAINKGK